MALHDQYRTVDLVQNWVNSLPPLNPSVSSSDLSSISPSSVSSTTPSSENSNNYPHLYSPTQSVDARHSKGDYNFHVSVEPSNKPPTVKCPNEKRTGQGISRRDSRLSWMHSNYGSFNSETSSIDLLLEERRANPEQILMNLGFGISDPSIGARLPARFLAGHTGATGINMQSFLRDHPELSRYMTSESSFAMGELYSRLPQCYRQVSGDETQTTLHKKFSQQSLDLQAEHSYAPLTVHKGEDGTMFASILTKSNTEQLERQGFYSEHSSPPSLVNQSSSSSISTHDCTIESIDTPSPIVLNNSPSESSPRNPFITNQSSGSDSVFSSTESYTVDQKVRAKLQAIHEKSLNEMNGEDLEEGISFVCRRHSDGELSKQTENSFLQPETDDAINIHHKRRKFARRKSRSFNEERFTQIQMLRDQLESCNVEGVPGDFGRFSTDLASDTPVIVTTDASQEDAREPVIPKQCDGMLQVSFNIESFDSVDSDTGTIVPSPYASPYQGMSPNTSRNGSLSVLPAMESFELEEVQSCTESGDANLALPTSKRKRVKLQRSVSNKSDSDSSGIADVDGKSHNGQNDSPESKDASEGHAVSQQSSIFLSPPVFCQTDGSISSSNQTLNSVNTVRTSASCVTIINQHGAAAASPRRSSESDVADLRYYSLSSAVSNASSGRSPYTYKQYQDAECQTERLVCTCGNFDKLNLSNQNTDWQVNNIPAIKILPTASTSQDNETPNDTAYRQSGDTAADPEQPVFYIVNSEGDWEGDSDVQNSSASLAEYTSTDNQNNSAHDTFSEAHRVEEMRSEMTRDLKVLRELFEKYDIGQPRPRPMSGNDHGSLKQEIVSTIQEARFVLSADITPACGHNIHSIHSDSSQFAPISGDSRNSDENFNSGKLANHHPDLLPGSRSKANYSHYNRTAGLNDDFISPSRRRACHDRYGSVSSTPVSIHSSPNSHTASSASSSTRLAEQLKLAERKCKYERQIASLEIQKYKLTNQMKDEEIEYWKSLSEQCDANYL